MSPSRDPSPLWDQPQRSEGEREDLSYKKKHLVFLMISRLCFPSSSSLPLKEESVTLQLKPLFLPLPHSAVCLDHPFQFLSHFGKDNFPWEKRIHCFALNSKVYPVAMPQPENLESQLSGFHSVNNQLSTEIFAQAKFTFPLSPTDPPNAWFAFIKYKYSYLCHLLTTHLSKLLWSTMIMYVVRYPGD